MIRAGLYLACVFWAAVIHAVMIYNGREAFSLTLPLTVIFTAFVLPMGFPLIGLDHLGVPVGGIAIITVSLIFWFFPTARFRRWAGVYDATAHPPHLLPWLARGFARVLDAWDRRNFGRRKGSKWA